MRKKSIAHSATLFLAIVVSAISWFPWQNIIYLTPIIIVILSLLFYLPVSAFGTAPITILPLAVLALIGVSSSIVGMMHGSSLPHAVMWMVTNSSLMLAYFGWCVGRHEAYLIFYKVVKFNVGLGCTEALLGIYQYWKAPSFDETAAAGDYVFGTLGTNSHLYAVKMLILVVAAYVLWRRFGLKRYLLSGALLFQAWLLASALHTVVIAIAAVVTYVLIFRSGWKRVKAVCYFIAFALLLIGSLYIFQERNMYYLLHKLALYNPADPYGGLFGKIALYYRTIFWLPHDYGVVGLLIGVGVGSYSSRASWILSGEYLKNQEYISVSPSPIWQHYLRDLWNPELLESFRWAHGVANQPMSSWISVLGELGYVGIAFVLLGVSMMVLRYRTFFLFGDVTARWVGQLSLLMTLFLCMAFFFDNWIEYPQLMMPAVVLLSLGYRVSTRDKSR